MRKLIWLGVLFVLAATLVAATATTAGANVQKGVTVIAPLRDTSKAVVGFAWINHREGRATGWIVATGLTEGKHAMHIHGEGNCKKERAGTSAPVVVPLKDLTADADGVARYRVNMKMNKKFLAKGYYLNIHEMSTADGVGPGIVCGNLRRVSELGDPG